MADIININSLDPNTFELQTYSTDDTSLITNIEVQTSFDPLIDKIEYFIYNLNGDILYSNVTGYGGYRLIDNNLVLDPETDVREQGYDQGQYNTIYNFVSPKLSSSPSFPYFISQISPDRTEVRLDTTSIPNDLVISSSQELISNIQTSTGSYYDFYLDFGDNQLIIANNALLDTSSIDNPTVLIKLYEPLPPQFDINTQLWVITQIANSVAYNVSINQVFDVIDESIQLKGPNLNISIQDQINNSTDYTNLSQLNTTNQSQGSGSLQYQLNSMLAQTGVEINVDYSDYANFIHFSSAQTRLENFYYKLSLIETYNYSASYSSGTITNQYVSSSNVIWQNKIDEIITGFDDYEYYLYYSSGSTSWPKSNSTPPYINYTTTSTSGSNWFVSQSAIAEEYDNNNNNALINAIPSYLKDDSQNAQFELFVEMIGQYFDTIFLYTQDVTNKYNADNRVNYGVSKDLVADILRDMGIKIYQNNFSTNDLYSALLGFTPSGSLYNLPYTTGSLPTPTGYEYINTYVTASATGSLIPTEDINAEIYKRIYANLPYLLKKKGSAEGLKALITIYGIPDTILQVNEFGGQNKVIEDDYDLWFDQFNYTLDTQGTNYVTSSFTLDSNWNATDNVPSAVEFRFQTRGIPASTGYYSQSLWSTDNGAVLRLRYTGSGYTSGSYSGSIPNPYNEFALLELIPDVTILSTSASVYLPVFDEGWWSVLINRDGTDFTLVAGNKDYLGSDANYVAYLSSSTVTGNDAPWISSTVAYLGSGSLGRSFSGSLQEYRFYTETLNTSSFEDYIMYPYSIDANGINTAPTTLAFRATLGGELYTSSISIHPKVTGSWATTSSFTGTSTFKIVNDPTFISNVETVYPNQFPAGIKNRVSNKIRQQNEVLPYSGSSESNLPQNTALSPFISVQQTVPASGSYTPNIDYVEVAFSPQNEINNDIAGQLGYFNLGDYIGDPRLVSSSAETYPELDALRNYYFDKYTSNYNIWDYIRLIKYFDNSLFKMIQDWVPARTDLASGIVIKQTVLERNKYPVPQLDTYTTTSYYSGSGWNTPGVSQDIEFTGSIEIYTVTGSTGGTAPNLVPTYAYRAVTSSTGQTYLAEYGTPLDPVLNLTQSWLGSTPSLSGSVPFTQSNAQEFFNGELSGSNYVVEDGELNPLNPVKKAPTQLLSYKVTGSNAVINGTGYPGSGDIYWAFTEGVSGGVLTVKDYVNEIWINETSNNSIDILNALQNFQVGNTINFTVTYTLFDGVVTYLTQTKNIITPIESIAPITADVWRIGLPFNSGTTINNDNFTYTVLYLSGSSNVIFNPYLNSVEDYSTSEYNPLIDNAVESRPNDEFFDVDFSTNAITAVNARTIISASRDSGSATPSTVPASNYTTARITIPRYIGKELTSAKLNEWTEGDVAYGKTANVSNPETNFVYFNYVGGSSPEWGNQNQDRSIVNVRYIIDQNGNVTKPINDSSGINLGTIQQTFEEDKNATLVLDDNDTFGVNLNSLNGSWPIFKSGYRIEPIIYTQTASYDNNGNIINFGYTGSINFVEGEQGPDVTKNDYKLLTYGQNFTSINSSTSLPAVIQFSSPVILGESGSFSTSTDAYNPTGSLAQLSGSGYILYLKAEIVAATTYLAAVTYAIQKSTNGGSSWTNLATTQILHNNATSGSITYTENAATTSSLYRVAATTFQNILGTPTVQINAASYFQITQFPNPGTGVCTSFWNTGLTSNILLASTASEGLNNYVGQKQIGIDRSGFNPITNDFELQPYDEIRFQGIENLAFYITNITSSATGQLTLNLDRNIPAGTNLDYFLVRRYVEDPSSIILDVDKPAGGSSGGILKPQYLSSAVESNLDTIIQNLKSQNLI